MSKKNEGVNNLLNSFEESLLEVPNGFQLKINSSNSFIKPDLSASFQNFFLLNSFRYLILKNLSKRGILLVSTEDNSGVQQFYKNKNFLCKSFQIKVNERRYVIQITVEKNGVFKSLHDDEHINGLIWGIDPCQDYIDGIKFNEQMDSIHFVYAGSEESESSEIVILSVQTYL